MSTARSGCPIANILDVLGDRWSLLVIRDIGLHDKTSFRELAEMDEGISTSTLTNRLERLAESGLVTKERTPGGPGRQFRYGLTERGADLLPVLLDIIEWGGKHDPHSKIPSDYLDRVVNDRDAFLARKQARWRRVNVQEDIDARRSTTRRRGR